MEPKDLQLLAPWQALSPERAEHFLRELENELDVHHPLYGVELKPIALSTQADDVLFQLNDGRVAMVHLTWKSRPETPPWPHHTIYLTFEDWVQKVILPEHDDFTYASSEPHA
jgi:hypothetical protein